MEFTVGSQQVTNILLYIFNPQGADEVLIPRRLKRFIAITDNVLLCGVVVRFFI
jgi:hypothetical protein